MHVFICWSGELSHMIADELEKLINDLFGGKQVTTFVSSDIEKGTFWSDKLKGHLQKADAGIVCFTPQNLGSPWIHFEAGTIASHLAIKQGGDFPEAAPGAPASGGPPETNLERDIPIYPLLHSVQPSQLGGPLSRYQATTTEEKDFHQLIAALARRAGFKHAECEEFLSNVESKYEHFRKKINTPYSVGKVVPDFEAAFRRKTFDEPVQQCVSQRWLARYNGVRDTESKLRACLLPILDLLQPHQKQLVELLEEALDRYADTTAALLMPEQRFEMAGTGERQIDPGVREGCERQRLRVKRFVSRIVDSADKPPLRRDAVLYFGAETFEEKKLLVQLLENRVRQHYDIPDREEEAGTGTDCLRFTRDVLVSCRGSPWALDRIFYYLCVQYHPEATIGEQGCGIRDVQLEMERFAASPSGHSLMPVGYALAALHSLVLRFADKICAEDVQSVLKDISREIDDDPTLDAGRRLRKIIEDIQRALRSDLGGDIGERKPATELSRVEGPPSVIPPPGPFPSSPGDVKA